MQQSKEERFLIADRILLSPDWQFLAKELEGMVKDKDIEGDGYALNAETEKMLVAKGIQIGIRMALELPKKIRNDSRSFMDRARAKFNGIKT